MESLDLSSSRRIPEMIELLRRVSTAQDPVQIQREFAQNMRTVPGLDGYVSLSVRGLNPGEYKVTRAALHQGLGEHTTNPWADWGRMPVRSGGFLGRIIEAPVPRVFHRLDLRGDPVLGDALVGYRSCMAIPLFDDGLALNWGITLSLQPAMFTPASVEEFLMRGNLIGRMVKNLVVAKQVKELNARLTEQLEQVAQLQRSLLPDQLPRAPGLRLATSYLTSNESGGDYYDFFDMGDQSLGVVVADVSGHGAGAAAVMAMLQTILHGYPDRSRGPAAMLEHANRELLAKRLQSQFVTAFFGVFGRDRSTLTYSNAGHNRPQRRFASGGVHEIDGAASLPLGIIEEPEYRQATLDLRRGDTVVVYTDGITEAFSPPPEREMFGAERLTEALERSSGDPEAVVDDIHQRLFAHTHSRDRTDDQTIVAVRVDNA